MEALHARKSAGPRVQGPQIALLVQYVVALAVEVQCQVRTADVVVPVAHAISHVHRPPKASIVLEWFTCTLLAACVLE